VGVLGAEGFPQARDRNIGGRRHCFCALSGRLRVQLDPIVR
jgi:hypothetical protein